MMARALFLAERGRGRTSPNPIVGAVVVTPDGVVAGQGAHLEAGGPHAEIHALAAAGARARGATLYCTLEPCCHTGRTGPCTDAILAAGIARVVVAAVDPNPRVAGQGLAILQRHGVAVVQGEGAGDACRQNAPFFTWVTKSRPFVTIKSAVSADGFVGRLDRRVMITGPAAERWAHRQRAEVDAIAVGSSTVLIDDPQITARGAYRFRPLVRVVFDRRARVAADARLFSTLGDGPVIMVVSAQAARARSAFLADLEARGIVVDRGADDGLDRVLGRLAQRGVLSLLVEGGPTLQQAFADAGLVDRVQRLSAPATLGSGIPAAAVVMKDVEAGIRRLALGDDTLTEFDVHRTH